MEGPIRWTRPKKYAKRVYTKVNPDMLRWAIERAGYGVENFLVYFSSIEKWIQGKRTPNVKQLLQFADFVDVPLGYLMLDHPPEEKLPIPFFHTKKGPVDKVSLNVFNALLLMQVRQQWLTYYLRDNGASPHGYVGRFGIDADVETIVDDMRDALDITEYWARSLEDWNQAFYFLIQRIEKIGVSIIFSSTAKQDNFRPIPLEECRAMALNGPFAPYIFINAADSQAAQMFTIVYALAHIWLGQDAGFDLFSLRPARDPVEALCYRVASTFLLSANLLHHAWEKKKDLERVVKFFRISPIAIMRRSVDIGRYTEFDFFKFYGDYNEYDASKPNLGRRWGKSRGSTYVDMQAEKQRRMGNVFARYARQATLSNELLYQDAYRMSRMTGKTYRDLISRDL